MRKIYLFVFLFSALISFLNITPCAAQCPWTVEVYNPDSFYGNPEPNSTWVLDEYSDEFGVCGEIINSGNDTMRGLVNYCVYLKGAVNQPNYELHRETVDISQLPNGYLAPGEGFSVCSGSWDNNSFFMSFDEINYELGFPFPFKVCMAVYDPENSMSNACETDCMFVTDCDGMRTIDMEAVVCINQPYDFFGQQVTQEGYYHHYDTTDYCIVHYRLYVGLVVPPPTITLYGDTSFCEGGGTVITASTYFSNENFVWSDGTNTRDIHITSGGVYSVTATSVSGCSASKDVIITVLPNPEIQLAGSLRNCDGTPVELLLTTENISGVHWSDGTTGNTFTTSQSGSYSVTVTGESGCVNSSMFDVVSGLPSQSDITMSASHYLAFNGTVYTQSGNYTCIIPNASGCDSTITLHLTIQQPGNTMVYYDTTCMGTHYLFGDIDTVFEYAGDYAFSLTSTQALQLHVLEYTSPSIICSGEFSSCSSDTVVLSVDGEASSYHWNTGAITPSITVTQAGYYAVTITDSHGCEVSSDYIRVGQSNLLNNAPEFCMATVLPNGYNVMNWDYHNNNTIGYNIYTMIDNSGEYIFSAFVHEDHGYLWADYNTLAVQHVYTYRVSAVDACERESEWSDPIQPMRLIIAYNSDSSLRLQWNAYEGASVSYYRAMHLIDGMDNQVGTTTETWFDVPEAIFHAHLGYYYIEAVTDNNCALQYGDASYSRPRSNQFDTQTVQIAENTDHPAFHVFPNPTSDKLNIEIKDASVAKETTIELFDIYGRRISVEKQSGNLLQMNLYNLKSGVYILRLFSGNQQIGTVKIVKQ